MAIPRKRNRLRNMGFDEVSLCKEGMNQRSKVLLVKSHNPQEVRMPEDTQDPVSRFTKALGAALGVVAFGKKSDGTALADDKAQADEIQKHMVEVGAALDAEVPELLNKAVLPKGDESDDDEESDPSQMAKAFEVRLFKAESEARAATDRADKVEKALSAMQSANDVGIVRKAILDATPDVGVNVEELTKALLPLAASDRETILKTLRSANAAAASGSMTTTRGVTVQKATSSEAKLEELAKARSAEKSITFAKAYTQVLDENRELYSGVRAEQGFSA